MKIHDAMLSAMTDIAKLGIRKTSKASLGGATVNYRGIESAMNEMSGVLIRAGLRVTAEYSDLQISDRPRNEDKFTRIVVLRGAFTFTADDDSSVVFACYGEAADTMDKAVTKAQSVAFRTALFQAFVVPTMSIDPEADGDDGGEFDGIFAGIASLQTDADALAYWKDHVKSFRPNSTDYMTFRRMVEAKRVELKNAA